MTIPTKSCSCATTRTGQPCGCKSVDVVDTEYGPRFRETSCRGDASPLEKALEVYDAEQALAAAPGVPACASWVRADAARPAARKMLSVDEAMTKADEEARAAYVAGPPAGATWLRR